MGWVSEAVYAYPFSNKNGISEYYIFEHLSRYEILFPFMIFSFQDLRFPGIGKAGERLSL